MALAFLSLLVAVSPSDSRGGGGWGALLSVIGTVALFTTCDLVSVGLGQLKTDAADKLLLKNKSPSAAVAPSTIMSPCRNETDDDVDRW